MEPNLENEHHKRGEAFIEAINQARIGAFHMLISSQ